MVCSCRCLYTIGVWLFVAVWLIYTYRVKQWLREPLPNHYYFQKDIRRKEVIRQTFGSSVMQQPQKPDLIVGVITAHRVYGKIDFKYPEQVVGSFFQMQSAWKEFGLFLCVASVPALEPLTFLEKHFEPRYRIRLSNPRGSYTKQKELKDYLSCLSTIKEKFPSAKYIVLNEDDGLPLEQFFENIKLIVKQLEYISHVHSHKSNVSHVKLHHPTSLRKIPYLIFAVALPLSILSLLKWYFVVFKMDVSNVYLAMTGVFIFSAIYLTGATRIGKLHRLLSPSYFPLAMSESCCTVSVLFPCDTLQATLNYLVTSSKENPLSPKDSLLDNLPSKTGMKVYMTEYNLVRHIGMFSSIRKNSEKLIADVEVFNENGGNVTNLL